MVRFNILKKLGIIVLCSILLTACDKYLDVKPKGYTLLNTVADYDQWLNNPDLALDNYTGGINLLSDLTDIPTIPVPASGVLQLTYLWTAQPATDASFWGIHYGVISSYNSVINGIDKANGGTESQKKALKAEALLGRAYECLNLINEYGKPYNSATAVQDPGIQLVTSDDVGQEVPARSTVQQTYDFILTDINAALENLPDDNAKNRFRPSKAAAYSLLARVYLYMRNYTLAQKNAELALTSSPSSVMVNYNNITAASPFPAVSIRTDAIYARLGSNVNFPTIDFMQRHNVRDTRLKRYYVPDNGAIPTQRGVVFYSFGGNAYGRYSNTGTSVQEMKLIIAEGAARGGDLTVALKQLDDVRKNRIETGFYQAYQSNDPEFVLQKVLDERTFEFPGNATHWFDMRRLDTEGRMAAVKRFDAQGNVIATLAPHSPRYTLQIPDLVLRYNPGMVQNP